MRELPKELGLSFLLDQVVPGDTTLGVLKGHFDNGEIAASLRSQSRSGQVRLRFVQSSDGQELPDGMTIAEFRKLAEEGEAHLSVDDGSGGVLEDA